MRACSGTWIAHGSGSADREVVDSRGRIRVPPGEQSYTLRRIWLTKPEERGYYYGFANEGLWPLCHIAHVRPVFRDEDWRQYRRVNERFADAVAQEAKTDDPVVLIQDYHFALLPRMVRERLPRATIITFWHIPWPNPSRSASVRGARRSSRACWAARSSAFTRATTATTSSRRSTASSRHASNTSPRRCRSAAVSPAWRASRFRSPGRTARRASRSTSAARMCEPGLA